MRNQIVEGKEFYILSRSVDNASKCIVTDVKEDCFEVALRNKGKYEVDESVELFTMTNDGQLYFETIVKEVKEDKISIWYPIDIKFLQRREYSRIKSEESLKLIRCKEEIIAEILDISAGGLKLKTDNPLSLLDEYDISLKIENQVINCKFKPIRIEANQSKYISSGQFDNIDNYDRIMLVQYCFRKLIENSSK